jgi:maleylacetoacetate isomerase
MLRLFSFWRSLATYRVRIALNFKGLMPDEEINIDLTKGAQRDAAYRAVNPMMALPVLVDGDGAALFESLAIIEYLDETHPEPPLLPADARGRARVRALAQIVTADCHPLVVPRVRDYLQHELKIDEPHRLAWCRHWHIQALAVLETHLGGPETGRFCHRDQVTIADICLASQVAGAQFFGVDLAPFPSVSRIVTTYQQIDAFARAHPLKQKGAPAA